MPEEAKKEEVKEEKTVDIDTSGPDVDIKLPEETKEEVEVKEEVKEEVQEPRTTEQEPEVKAEEEKKEVPGCGEVGYHMVKWPAKQTVRDADLLTELQSGKKYVIVQQVE